MPVTRPPTNPMRRRMSTAEPRGAYFLVGFGDSCAIAEPDGVGDSCAIAEPDGVGDSCAIADPLGEGIDPLVPDFGDELHAAPVNARTRITPAVPFPIRMC